MSESFSKINLPLLVTLESAGFGVVPNKVPKSVGPLEEVDVSKPKINKSNKI
jgi:hypothetical protein